MLRIEHCSCSSIDLDVLLISSSMSTSILRFLFEISDIVILLCDHVIRAYRVSIVWTCQQTYCVLKHVFDLNRCVNHDAARQTSWQFYCNHCMISLIVLHYRRMKWSFCRACLDALLLLQSHHLRYTWFKYTNEHIVLVILFFVQRACQFEHIMLLSLEHIDRYRALNIRSC